MLCFVFSLFKKIIKQFIFIYLSVFCFGQILCAADLPRIEWQPKAVFQGGTVWLRIYPAKSAQVTNVTFNSSRILLDFDSESDCYVGIVPVCQDTPPGIVDIKISFAGQKVLTKSVQVLAKKFPTQYLTLPESKVNLCQQDLERHYREKNIVSQVFKHSAPSKRFTSGFMMPVSAEISTPFGVRRFMNRQPKNPHSGVDLAAEIATPVRATNTGVVACVGDHFFAGKSVYVDHGLGVISMYFHLSEIKVQKGDTVQKGAVLGLVGSSGRSTGPHLHWGVRINNVKVDPLSLIQLNKYL